MLPLRTSVALSLISTSACAAPSARFPGGDTVHATLAAAVQQGPGSVVSLDSVIIGEWRALYVFTPYTNSSHIRDCVGSRISTHGIEFTDIHTLLVLVPTKGAPATLAVRNDVGFAPAAANRVYPRGAASFLVQEPQPQSWGDLVPASGLTRSCS